MNTDWWNKAMKKLLIFVCCTVLFVSNPTVASTQDNDTYISEEIQGYCIEIGEMYGVCPELLMAIVEAESSGNPEAKNGNCLGLMQVSQRWHYDRMERLGVSDLFDPYGNILVGTDYLMELAYKYGDLGLVLDKYNGNSKAEYNAENGIVSEYANKVLTRAEELERIHGK